MGTVGPTPHTTNSWVSRPDPAQNAAPERGLFVVKRLVELSSLRVTAEMAAARDGS